MFNVPVVVLPPCGGFPFPLALPLYLEAFAQVREQYG